MLLAPCRWRKTFRAIEHFLILSPLIVTDYFV